MPRRPDPTRELFPQTPAHEYRVYIGTVSPAGWHHQEGPYTFASLADTFRWLRDQSESPAVHTVESVEVWEGEEMLARVPGPSES